MANFWSSGDTAAIPKRNFRFLVKIGGEGDNNLPVWVAKSTQLPNFSVGEAKVHFVNHEFKYPGKVTYQDLQITLIEAVDPNTSFQLLSMFSESGYKNPSTITNTNAEGEAQNSIIFKSSAIEDVTLTHLGGPSDDGGAVVNNIYTLKNAWVKNITLPQSLDYSSEDVSDVQITFAYDYFTAEGPAGVDVGGGFT